jgi:hypothetical protein
LSAGTSGGETPASDAPVLPHLPRATRSQQVLIVAVLLSYLIGYPVALMVDSSIGWVLVTLGGVFLMALGVVTIRRVHRSGNPRRQQGDGS